MMPSAEPNREMAISRPKGSCPMPMASELAASVASMAITADVVTPVIIAASKSTSSNVQLAYL